MLSTTPSSGFGQGPAPSSHFDRELLEAETIREELEARRARRDLYFWLTEATRTKDEQDSENPYKPFPKRRFIRPILDVLRNETAPNILKSRTMLMTWTVCGYAAHTGFNRPATGVLVYSQDEDRAVHCVECVKILWDNSSEALKRYWPLKKELAVQPYNRLEMANGSWFMGIPGKDPNKIRHFHPTIVIFDEAAFIENGEEAYNVAAATKCPQMIRLSSANEGYYDELFKSSAPVDWPIYRDDGNDQTE